jgi:hypothetical protein
MLLFVCRYLALCYAVGLAIGEAVINSNRPEWQYAPLWIIDYVIVLYLLAGFWATRNGRNVPVLMSAYALSTGVLYIVVFLNLDPEVNDADRTTGTVFYLMVLVLVVSVFGLTGTTLSWWVRELMEGGPLVHQLVRKLPKAWADDIEADSRKWMVRCSCGHEVSIWDIGGVRYKAHGNPKTVRQCPSCGWSVHTIYKKEEPASPA